MEIITNEISDMRPVSRGKGSSIQINCELDTNASKDLFLQLHETYHGEVFNGWLKEVEWK